MVEVIERREMLDTGVGIITGAVFLDSNDSGAIDPADAPLVGATIELYRVGESTPLATTLTDSRGAYAFRALDPGSYVVTQVPPSGRKVLANRVTSDVHAIASTTPEAVTVTVRDPASVFVNYGGVVPDQYLAIRTVVGGTPSIDAVGALAGTIGSAPGASDINPGFNTFCLDDLARVPFAGGISFAVVPRAIGDLEVNGATTPISTDHAERIAYIFNHYGNSSLTNFQAAGVQLAIWELLYDEGATPDFTAGNFQVTGAANSGEQALVDQAIAFASSLIAESQGNGESAILLEATAANNPNASGFQSMIGRFGLDFLLTNLPPAAKASISGHVYVDANDNGIRETGEAPIAGVVVRLQGSDTIGTPVDLTTTTDATGFYQFTNLVAGTYTLSETQPTAYDDGKDTQGTPGTGLTENDRFRDVVLLAGVNGVDNDYGELVRPAPLPASISGHVYVDANDNGIRDTGEAPIAGVIVRLQGTTSAGQGVDLTTTTDATGFYLFTNLTGGSFTLTETQPSGYIDGKDTQGTPGTGIAENDRFRDIVLPAGINGVDNDFGERLSQPALASISGHVFRDANDNGQRDAGEEGIVGVVVRLHGADETGRVVDQTTTTDLTGFYQFANLTAGTYTLTETQPKGYVDGKDSQGTPGTGIAENDRFRDIRLTAGTHGVDNDFGEILPAPAVTKLERFGVHQQATTLVLHFDAGLDPRQAIDTANYALVALGRDEKLGTADDRRIPLRSAVYDPAAGTVTLIPAQRLNVHYHYALSLDVPPAAAGASHARYVTVFGRSSLASVTKHNGAVVAPPPLSERDRLRQEHVLKRAEAVIAKHGGLPARSTIRLGHATRVAPATNSARSLGTATRLAPKGPNGQS